MSLLQFKKSILPDPDQEEVKKLTSTATAIVCSAGRQRVATFLAICMIENVKLLQEVNRLRKIQGEELLPVYK